MTAESYATQLLSDVDTVRALPDARISQLVDELKQEADRHWWIDANRSLVFADLIVDIGQARGDHRIVALGTMARGDALKMLGQLEDAWETLERAGQSYHAAGDEIGWARTRIGRLPISVNLHRVPEALTEAERARAIFIAHNDRERLLRLSMNTAVVYDMLGDYRQSLALYQQSLALAEALGDTGAAYEGALYLNMGYAYNFLGDLHQALAHYERARAILESRNETQGMVVAELNIAYIAIAQGQYRRALDLLYGVLDRIRHQFPHEAALARREIVECYLYVNRFAEARDLAESVVEAYRAQGAAYETARTLLYLAHAEAELSNFTGALAALDAAEPIYRSLDAEAWLATLRLRRSAIALKRGETRAAYDDAATAVAYFAANGQQANYGMAVLLKAQALLASGQPRAAADAGWEALGIARRCNMPSQTYSTHVLLGHVHEREGRLTRARRHYQAAAGILERVQRGLTITLRPGFMENKGEALSSLIRLYLQANQTQAAFETLERAKSQVLLGYLAHRETLRWATDDAYARPLIDTLNRLRAEHQWYYTLLEEKSGGDRKTVLSPDEIRAEIASRERQMRAITEQLYLRSADDRAAPAGAALRDIQNGLSPESVLLEFYNDGAHLWAFTVTATDVMVYPLPTTVETVNQLIHQFQFNISCALKVGARSPVARGLTGVARSLADKLYDALLRPLESRFRHTQRLMIVPYGALHYLPFHLLYTGTEHLIERHEVVVLPASGLLTRPGVCGAGGARVLAHPHRGELVHTLEEGQLVQTLFSGSLHYDDEARRDTLFAPPVQILHIAAHAEHRIDQPDFSFIELADGQLYTDDLFQHDLSYELVTLSACETGRANVAAGDELIGLGRGFLYSGAGAMIASLWQVDDALTVRWMELMYQALRGGASKAEAVRGAQRLLLENDRQLHPAFWGAFQLIGDPSPLSSTLPVH